MKKRIDGKIYNIEYAQALALYSNNQPFGSALRFSETLYISNNGDYFLHGQGGAMTHYAKTYKSKNNSSGEAIVPMTEDQAKDWARRFCTRVIYREIFGEDA